jgi:hypothetical protein
MAYQLGVWRGCLRWRTLRPFFPVLRLSQWFGSSTLNVCCFLTIRRLTTSLTADSTSNYLQEISG